LLQLDDDRLKVGFSQGAELLLVQLWAAFEGRCVGGHLSGGYLPGMYGPPERVDLGEGQIILVVDVSIRGAFQSLLGSGVGFVGAKEYIVPFCGPRLSAVARHLVDAAGAVGTFAVLSLLSTLFFSTQETEQGTFRQICLTFDTFRHIFLAFPGRICYDKWADCPYRDG